MRYCSSKYSVEIDEIYIKKIFVANFPKVEQIVEALKEEGCCKSEPKFIEPKLNNKAQKPEKNNYPPINDKDDIIVIE